MHYIGFVFVDEPTDDAVKAAMQEHYERKWHWYRCGGRWDGYFGGEEEMKRRKTHNGFNFESENNSASRNACRVNELPPDKIPYFFIADYNWVPKKYYNEYVKSSYGDYYGEIVKTPDFEKRFREAIAKYKDKWVVVVDAHN